jgi:hypothetical protein
MDSAKLLEIAIVNLLFHALRGSIEVSFEVRFAN